jgi:hypothetical protein
MTPNLSAQTVTLNKRQIFPGYKTGRRWYTRNANTIPFECGYCSQTFRTAWSRDRHMQQCHNGDSV